jgi:hypothetical protein
MVANLFELYHSEPTTQAKLSRLKISNIHLKPLVLRNLNNLMLFQKLTERTFADNDSTRFMLSREEIPNFYKNINVIFSKEFVNLLEDNFHSRMRDSSVFSDEYIKFHLEIEEADEVYAYKRDRTHQGLSKLLNNVELIKIEQNWIDSFSPSNGRFLTTFEQNCMNVLICSKEYHY